MFNIVNSLLGDVIYDELPYEFEWQRTVSSKLQRRRLPVVHKALRSIPNMMGAAILQE